MHRDDSIHVTKKIIHRQGGGRRVVVAWLVSFLGGLQSFWMNCPDVIWYERDPVLSHQPFKVYPTAMVHPVVVKTHPSVWLSPDQRRFIFFLWTVMSIPRWPMSWPLDIHSEYGTWWIEIISQILGPSINHVDSFWTFWLPFVDNFTNFDQPPPSALTLAMFTWFMNNPLTRMPFPPWHLYRLTHMNVMIIKNQQ